MSAGRFVDGVSTLVSVCMCMCVRVRVCGKIIQ